MFDYMILQRLTLEKDSCVIAVSDTLTVALLVLGAMVQTSYTMFYFVLFSLAFCSIKKFLRKIPWKTGKAIQGKEEEGLIPARGIEPLAAGSKPDALPLQ